MRKISCPICKTNMVEDHGTRYPSVCGPCASKLTVKK